MKRFIPTLLVLLVGNTLFAQAHYNLWFRNTLGIPVQKKIKIDIEFQHRRQNGYGNINPLDRNLMFTLRGWLHYQHNADVKFSLSPFAYFSNYKIIKKLSDETERASPEIRFSTAAEYQHKLFNQLYVTERPAMEYRLFYFSKTSVLRLRNRVGFRYDFNEKLKMAIYDELFFNLKGTAAPYFFDQNRVGANIEYKIQPSLKVEFGYIYLIRQPVSNHTLIIHENNLALNLTYVLNTDK